MILKFFHFGFFPIRGRHSGDNRTEHIKKIYYARCPSCRNLLVVGNQARPFTVLGCTLLRKPVNGYCTAKPVNQSAIIASISGFLHQACIRSMGPAKYESDSLPTEPLGLSFVDMMNDVKSACCYHKTDLQLNKYINNSTSGSNILGENGY